MNRGRIYLWVSVLIFAAAAAVVACGQLSWLAGIKRVRPADIATASAFSPIAGVLFAYLLLGEVPMQAQYIGGGMIVVGIAVGLLSELRPAKGKDKAKAFTGV